MSRYRSPRFASWRRRDVRLRHVLECGRNARAEGRLVKRRPPVLSISRFLRDQRADGVRYGMPPRMFQALAGGRVGLITDPAELAGAERAFGVRLTGLGRCPAAPGSTDGMMALMPCSATVRRQDGVNSFRRTPVILPSSGSCRRGRVAVPVGRANARPKPTDGEASMTDTKASLHELAARVEAAEGPSRELDGRIFMALNPDAKTCAELIAVSDPRYSFFPAYTASLDAALPGEEIEAVTRHKGDGYCVWRALHAGHHVPAQANTEPLARRAAALRARAEVSK